jgi:hypothetical protein
VTGCPSWPRRQVPIRRHVSTRSTRLVVMACQPMMVWAYTSTTKAT